MVPPGDRQGAAARSWTPGGRPRPACSRSARRPSMPLKPGSAGKPFFGQEAEILDEAGDPVADGEEGFLVLKNPWPAMMRTLYKDDQRYIDTYWSKYPGKYLAGDSARRDEDGYFWVIGRTDDVIKVSGHRLGTAEVESALVSHPAVAEAAAIGLPHEVKGNAIHAFVVLRMGFEGSQELAEDLRKHVSTHLSPIAKPDCDRLHREAAQDPLGQDHAPRAEGPRARPGRGRPHHAGGVTSFTVAEPTKPAGDLRRARDRPSSGCRDRYDGGMAERELTERVVPDHARRLAEPGRGRLGAAPAARHVRRGRPARLGPQQAVGVLERRHPHPRARAHRLLDRLRGGERGVDLRPRHAAGAGERCHAAAVPGCRAAGIPRRRTGTGESEGTVHRRRAAGRRHPAPRSDTRCQLRRVRRPDRRRTTALRWWCRGRADASSTR